MKLKYFAIGIFGFLILVVTLWSADAIGLLGRPVTHEEWFPVVEENDELVFVSGTEYFPGQEGQIAVMITNKDGDVVTGDYNCNYTVLYPNKTMFVQGNFTTISDLGTYHTNFTIPAVDGVYEYGSICSQGSKKASAGKSFHVTYKRIRAFVTK